MTIGSKVKIHIKSLVNRIADTDGMRKEISALQFKCLVLSSENTDLRLKLKKATGQKIRVLFICHRPALWASLKSIYEAMRDDDAFEPMILAIPNKKQLPDTGFAHEEYETEGAEDFFEQYQCINGYNTMTGEWRDPREFDPDYVFLQTPYNATRHKEYKSDIISTYAKIAYVAYFPLQTIDDIYDECTPYDYIKDLSFYFAQSEDEKVYFENRISIHDNICKVINTGYPRYDEIMSYADSKCDIWNRDDTFKILWNTRWTTNEGNCNFFRYKQNFIDLLQCDDGLELTFRPHPQAFAEWSATGEMTADEQEQFRKLFVDSNMHLDESDDYYPLLFSSDCFVTDRSSLAVDYLCTTKPIILCKNDGRYDSLGESLDNIVYVVYEWNELISVLNDLRRGVDPLKEKRMNYIRNVLKIGEIKAGETIKKIIKADAMK